jgi:hypothetical protein
MQEAIEPMRITTSICGVCLRNCVEKIRDYRMTAVALHVCGKLTSDELKLLQHGERRIDIERSVLEIGVSLSGIGFPSH